MKLELEFIRWVISVEFLDSVEWICLCLQAKARDGWECVHPGCHETKWLHGHHKIPRSRRPDLALDLNNIETLCAYHHALEHPGNDFITMPLWMRRKLLKTRAANDAQFNLDLIDPSDLEFTDPPKKASGE